MIRKYNLYLVTNITLSTIVQNPQKRYRRQLRRVLQQQLLLLQLRLRRQLQR